MKAPVLTVVLLGLALCSTALHAETINREFPREESCHEGLAFSDGRRVSGRHQDGRVTVKYLEK